MPPDLNIVNLSLGNILAGTGGSVSAVNNVVMSFWGFIMVATILLRTSVFLCTLYLWPACYWHSRSVVQQCSHCTLSYMWSWGQALSMSPTPHCYHWETAFILSATNCLFKSAIFCSLRGTVTIKTIGVYLGQGLEVCLMTQKVPARASPLLLPDASHIGSSAVLPGEKSEGQV